MPGASPAGRAAFGSRTCDQTAAEPDAPRIRSHQANEAAAPASAPRPTSNERLVSAASQSTRKHESAWAYGPRFKRRTRAT